LPLISFKGRLMEGHRTSGTDNVFDRGHDLVDN
jgi:hypothetical protein